MWNAISSRIWTRVVVSISYDDNHYTTGSNYFIDWKGWNSEDKQRPLTSNIKVGQYTEKSPEDLRRLAVIQIPAKDDQLTLERKNHN